MDDDDRPLGERDQALLDFERNWSAHAGHKDAAIRARFAISSARYYQLLNRLLARPGALAYDPLTVRRLRRRRAQRTALRAGRALGERPGQ